MQKAIISTGKFAIMYVLAGIIGFLFFPHELDLFHVITCVLGANLGVFIVNLIYEKKKNKNKELHF